MRGVLSRCRRVFAVSVCALFCVTGSTPLHAQTGGAAIAGTVIDQAGKTVEGAAVVVKNDAGAAISMATTDAAGHFSAAGLAPGTYTVETSAPGFALNSRLGVPVSAAGSEELSITLNVDSVSQSITVQETISLATETAPSGNTLESAAPRTEISPVFIQNFISPVLDFAEVVEIMRPARSASIRTVSVSGRAKPFSVGSRTVSIRSVRRHSVRRHQHSRPTIPGPVSRRSGSVPWISTSVPVRLRISAPLTSADRST